MSANQAYIHAHHTLLDVLWYKLCTADTVNVQWKWSTHVYPWKRKRYLILLSLFSCTPGNFFQLSPFRNILRNRNLNKRKETPLHQHFRNKTNLTWKHQDNDDRIYTCHLLIEMAVSVERVDGSAVFL